MPRPGFRPPECTLFESRVPEWVHLKTVSAEAPNIDAMLAQRRKLIREVTMALLAKFPERDPSVNDPGPLTYSQEELEQLPERIRQWYRNRTRKPVDADTQKKKRSKGRTHARNLAAKQYSQQIKEIAREMRDADKDLKGITAFNRATTRFIAELKTKDPDAHEKLVSDAKQIRGSAAMDYTDLSPETLGSLLDRFPMKMLSELEQYGKELPVHIWCLCAFARPPNQQLELFTVCTPSLDQMSESAFDKSSRRDFLQWITDNLGEGAALQVDTAAPMVYPSRRKGLRPHVPQVEDLSKVSAHQLRAWLRTFFNYQHMWQGGLGSAPWKLLLSDRAYEHVPRACIPDELSMLKSPNDMSRHELETWYRWLLAGQEGRLREEQIFRFARVSPGKRKAYLTYSGPVRTRPDACKLVWSAEEKLYAAKVQQMADDALANPGWNDLPLARTNLIYQPFSPKIQTAIGQGCLPPYQTEQLVNLLVEMENYGPVHTQDITCDEPNSAYIKPGMSEDHIRHLLLGDPLSPSALMEDSPDYAGFALPTFVHWVKTNQRLRHRKSKTWRGGPYGVRWIIAIFVHFASAFSVYERLPRALPEDLLEALEALHFSKLKEGLIQLSNWLIASLKDTISMLKRTFAERAEAWRVAVVTTHLSEPDSTVGNSSVSINTHGLPRSRATLKECYMQLQSKDPDQTLGTDDIALAEVWKHVRKRTETTLALDEDELTDRDSLSGEEIDIPSFGDDTESSSNNTHCNSSTEFSDHDLGLYHSGFLSGRASADESSAEDFIPGSVLLTSEPSLNHTLDNATTNKEQQQDQPNQIHAGALENDPVALRSEAQSDADDEAEEMPSRILPEMSPLKLPMPHTPKKGGKSMVMEVVINTPRRKKSTGLASNQAHAPATKNDSDDSADDSPGSRSIAKRRPRRSIVRSARAEQAIRGARKGAYRRV